ncbi:MAG TPA: CHAT domain-containing protein [Candidatus Binatia bacterium]|nr:CHAT domain-containing protein [Candidatus Binatia bacterium]
MRLADMDAEALATKLWELEDEEARKAAISGALGELSHDAQMALAKFLKSQVDKFLRSDIQRCLQVARLLQHLAQLSGEPSHHALALLAEANARAIGLSQYQAAIELYEEAEQIYAGANWPVEQAQASIGKLWPLASLGRYEEALETGHKAAEVLAAAKLWLALGKLTGNLAIIHGRMAQDREALEMFNRARDIYRSLGTEGRPYQARSEYNRAIILRNLGEFEESIAASRAALALVTEDQPIDRARAQQSLAITYFLMGRYNEALQLFDEVRAVFLDDGRQRDAILVELFISDCLLQLRRFRDVLEKCDQVRHLFRDLGMRFEVAQAVLNEAVAYAGLELYGEAERSMQEARDLFAAEGNEVWLAFTALEQATVSLRQRNHDRALLLARDCIETFQRHELAVPEAQARLVAARACAALGSTDEAREQVQASLQLGETHGVPLLIYQARHLLGTLAEQSDEVKRAMGYYDSAIHALEQLRGRMMVEFRADFLEDKDAVYEDMVQLCLQLQRVEEGLDYAERAKSRALLDLLAYRLDVGVQARRKEDEPLVAELTSLRAERDRLYRRWESGEGQPQRGFATASDGWQQAQQEVLNIEQQITELWHRLLIRNADYARDAALWQVRTEPVQPYLDRDTVLLEYYVARGELLAFLVTTGEIVVRRMQAMLPEIQKLSQLLWLNLRSVPRAQESRAVALTQNARAILQKLHGLLLAPLQSDLASWSRLIVVPHGPLHYLPFQALFDGERYLLENYQISYLPGASFLRYCHSASVPVGAQMEDEADSAPISLAVGHSQGAQLPYTVQEAQAVAHLWQGQTIVEENATRQAVLQAAPGARLLHIAAHGDFRPDNPLFSGIALDDGWLTTLDIFNLRLQASLVTLSACQTGRNVVAGGDELLGLMRAFIYAGAASLLLTLWAVEDRSTARLMDAFYRNLQQGQAKAEALQSAQRQFILESGNGFQAHPYYWAPFFLVGATGSL